MRNVVLPILICVAFLVALAVGIVAMPQEEPGYVPVEQGEIVLRESREGELWLHYGLPDVPVTHIIKLNTIAAVLEGVGDGRQKTTVYFAGGKFFVPFTIQEFEDAVEKYFDKHPPDE